MINFNFGLKRRTLKEGYLNICQSLLLSVYVNVYEGHILIFVTPKNWREYVLRALY